MTSLGWKDKTILVTGATGFIGGRVCERLVQEGATKIRAMVHTIQRASRIARLPVELCHADLLDRKSLASVVAGSQIIIHCGLGIASGIARGTRNVLEAAEANDVKRFVHISTAAVYGLTPPPGSETEEAPLRKTGDAYCDGKAAAERVVARFVRRGVPAVVLRPSIVWGPHSAWSTRLIERLRQQEVGMIESGSGACNTTHVDNLVDAVFLAIESERAIGETFFITDGERITWGNFIQAHAQMFNPAPTLADVPKQQVVAYYRNQPGMWSSSLRAARRVLLGRDLRLLLLQIPLLKSASAPLWRSIESMSPVRKQRIKAILGSTNGHSNGACPPTIPFMPDEVDFATQTGTVFFAIDKARQVLGYEPRIRFQDGIRLVEQWLRFANYL